VTATTPPLFLLDPLPDGDLVRLTGDEGRHAARVRRLRPGEAVTLGDGRGSLADGTVAGVEPDGLSVHVHGRRSEPEPQPRLVVVQAIPKGERAELAVQLLTELGADEIVPWAAARAQVQWRGERAAKALGRWRRTAREAAKQSRRAWVPAVADPAATAAVVDRLTGAAGLVLHEQGAEPLVASPLPPAGDLLVIVGPEGGVAEDELAAFQAAGARNVRLGRPVLRTSTAGAAALAVLSARLGRWGAVPPSPPAGQ
jgi:16S rRNA (uracil1498-N3)-methyltransferase